MGARLSGGASAMGSALLAYLNADPEKRDKMAMFAPIVGAITMKQKAAREDTFKKASAAMKEANVYPAVDKTPSGYKFILKNADGSPVMNDLVRYEPGTGERIVVKPRGSHQKAGVEISIDKGDKHHWVSIAELPEDLQGKSIASALYTKAGMIAEDIGYKFSSDKIHTSKYARDNWEGGMKNKFDVEEHPDAIHTPEGVDVSTNQGFFEPAYSIYNKIKNMDLKEAAKKYGVPLAAITAYLATPEEDRGTMAGIMALGTLGTMGKNQAIFELQKQIREAKTPEAKAELAIIKQFLGESEDNKRKMAVKFPKLKAYL